MATSEDQASGLLTNETDLEVKKQHETPAQRHQRMKDMRKSSHIIIQDLPPTPKDICYVCDPCCEDDVRLAWLSCLTSWLLLGVLPVVIGIVGIRYAYKARNAKNPALKRRYSSISRSISWIGLALFISIMTVTVVILATSGIL